MKCVTKWGGKKKECGIDEGKVFSVNNGRRRRLVFAKLVSLTQTFDSLGSINAPRHVASKKERAGSETEGTESGIRRTKHAEKKKKKKKKERKKCKAVKERDGGKITTRINYETARRVSLFLALTFRILYIHVPWSSR